MEAGSGCGFGALLGLGVLNFGGIANLAAVGGDILDERDLEEP